MHDLESPEPQLAPARPSQLTVDFFEQSDSLAVHKKRAGGPYVFLLLWLIGWTVGCVFLIAQVINEPSMGTFAFAVPFWASWLFVAAMLVWMLFGKETLLLRPDEALFLRIALVRLTSRVVPREEIREFRECRSNHTENDEYLWGIEMVTLGKPVRFAFRLPEGERAWLIHRLNRFLRATGKQAEFSRDRTRPAFDRSSPPARSLSAQRAPAETEALRPETTLAEPPTDSSWQLTEEIEAFTFAQQGRLQLGALMGLLFVNAFWNGIVSVFVLALFGLMPMDDGPDGWEWWGMFVFLIPFEVIGLAMFVALIAAILEPFRHTTWRFEQHRIVKRTYWPIYRRTKSWDVVDLDRLELRRPRNGARAQRLSDATNEAGAQTPYALAFVSTDNADCCEISLLSEGEARWIAGVVMDLRRGWFGE